MEVIDVHDSQSQEPEAESLEMEQWPEDQQGTDTLAHLRGEKASQPPMQFEF